MPPHAIHFPAMKLTVALLTSFLAFPTLLSAQSVDVTRAVEVTFETTPGNYQVLEQSSDLSDWSPAAPALFAGPQQSTQFFPTTGKQMYYRLVSSEVIDLEQQLAPIRAAHNLPALGCAVVMSNRIVALGVVGVRKHGVTAPVTVNDLWHHGSMTKR